MTQEDGEESLSGWRKRLAQLDADLAERERAALALEVPDPVELQAIAALRHEAGAEWDTLAEHYDAWAQRRDDDAVERDDAADERDVSARLIDDDRDAGFLNRRLSAIDRDDSAGDRADSADDRDRGATARARAGADREHAANARDTATEQTTNQGEELAGLHQALDGHSEIGQAIGLLMTHHNLSTDDAFALLCRQSHAANVNVGELATSLVAEAQP